MVEKANIPPGSFLRWAAGLYLVLASSGVLWLGAQKGTISLGLFISPEGWLADLGLGLAAAALLIAVWQAGVHFLRSARELERAVLELLGPLEQSEVVTLALLSGFAEELFFRGALQGEFGWLAAAVLFGLLHIGPGKAFRLWTLFALIAGFLLGVLVVWRGALLAPIIAHVVVNGVGLFRISRMERPGHENADQALLD